MTGPITIRALAASAPLDVHLGLLAGLWVHEGEALVAISIAIEYAGQVADGRIADQPDRKTERGRNRTEVVGIDAVPF